jgi:myosin-1
MIEPALALMSKGKYLEIMFNTLGQPVGAQITNYLLEKVRSALETMADRRTALLGRSETRETFTFSTSSPRAPARSKKVGASGRPRADVAEAFGLQGPDAYAYTSRSGCLDVRSINDVSDFQETMVSHPQFAPADSQRAMQVIGLTANEQNSIFKVLATILWLGNVEFVEGDDGNATVADPGVTDFAAYLMEVDPAQLQKVLLTRIMETQRGGRRGEQWRLAWRS